MNQELILPQHVNFGPCHPAIKGMMRLMLELDGEVIQKGYCYLGFTHKGWEKILENKNSLQVQKLLENMDQNFLTPYGFSYAYALGVEKILNVSPPLRAQFIRVILAEMGRIFSHLHQIAAISESVDFTLTRFWALNLIEQINYVFLEVRHEEKIFLIPGGVSADLSEKLLKKIEIYLKTIEKKIQKIKSVLLTNGVFKLRTCQVGVVSETEAIAWGLSGPSLRASKVAWDLRRTQPYDVYEQLEFKVPVGTHGDSFERTSLRIEEIIQSIHIIKQSLDLLPSGDVCSDEKGLMPPSKNLLSDSTEAMIHHYKFFTEGIRLPKTSTYTSIEGARGEVGLFLASSGPHFFDRVRLRTPGFFNMQIIESLLKGHTFSDLPPLLSSFDIYSAEIDR